MAKRDTAHTRIKSLRCYHQVITLKQTGATNAIVARYVEEEGEAWWPAGSRTGEQAVRRFFEDNPELGVTKDPVLAQSIEKRWDGEPPSYITRLRDQVESSLDALIEMENLFVMQKRRIEVYCKKEQEGEAVGASLRAEMGLGLRMLNDVARLQMDTGVLTKEPMKIDARIAQWSQVNIGKELQNLLESSEGVKENIRAGLIED